MPCGICNTAISADGDWYHICGACWWSDGVQARDSIRAFVARVNARAEADMLAGNPITGAHHRAIESELRELGSA